ncbi:hypothetical protein KAW64_02780 [bacterium]|nr:hypothetical protein [bacterium]
MGTLFLVHNPKSFPIERARRVFYPGNTPMFLEANAADRIDADPRLTLEPIEIGSLGKDDLVDLAGCLSLGLSGTKPELVARIKKAAEGVPESEVPPEIPEGEEPDDPGEEPEGE